MNTDREFWGEQGRVGWIGAGPQAGGFVFAYPDTLPNWWTIVVEPSPYPDVAGEDYVFGDEVMGEIIDALHVEWLEEGAHENEIEQSIFGRRPLRPGPWWL